MDWRREDSVYAAATVVAFTIVAYLLAANFGLIPSPLAPGLASAPAAVAALPAPRSLARVPVVKPPPAIKLIPPVNNRPTHVTGKDMGAPKVAFSTTDGTQFDIVTPGTVSGTVKDAVSGVDQVLVSFKPVTGPGTTVIANLVCTAAGRQVCSWTADVPGVAGRYTVDARATDRAGNKGEAKPIDVTAVNSGGAVQQVTGVVARVPTALEKVVNGLLNGIL